MLIENASYGKENDLLPAPGIEPGPPGWKPEILTTRPCGRWHTPALSAPLHRSGIRVCRQLGSQQGRQGKIAHWTLSSFFFFFLFVHYFSFLMVTIAFPLLSGQRQMVPLRVGFEPTREDPIWFLVKRLNHSAIAALPLSWAQATSMTTHSTIHLSKGTARIWTGDLLFTRQAL